MKAMINRKKMFFEGYLNHEFVKLWKYGNINFLNLNYEFLNSFKNWFEHK